MPLRILYLHYLFGGDTAHHHVDQFARAAGELGHEVSVHALNLGNHPGLATGDSTASPTSGAGVHALLKRHLSRYLHEPKELWWNRRYLALEKNTIERMSPDVLLVRDHHLGISFLRAARSLGVPIVVEMNSPAIESRLFNHQYWHLPFFAEHFERRKLEAADAVSAVSSPLRSHLLERANIDPEKIRVVPNGADPRIFSPHVEPDDALPEALANRPIIGFVGSFQAFHGPDLLADMTLEVARRDPSVAFLYVGSGRGLARVRQRTASLGERVHFTDRVAHGRVPGLIRRMNIGVLPDTGFYCSPLKVLEWMSSGLAVVAPRYACMDDVLTDGREAVLFEPGDLEALVTTLLDLLSDESRRRSLGNAAAKRVREQLTWQDNASRVIALCCYAIEKHRLKKRSAGNVERETTR